VVDQAVQVYVPAACGDATNARVTYTGLGDFQPTSDPTEVVAIDSSGFVLAQSPATREIVLGPLTDAGPWAGAALVPDAGNLELLALPLDRACHFSTLTALASNAGTTLGMVDPTHAFLIGGKTAAFVANLGTGLITVAPAPPSPRNYATVSPMSGGVLIAGGENPALNGEVQATAYLYTPGVGTSPGTYGEPIVLMGGLREEHAAVTLPDGRVILVGGVTARAPPAIFLTAIDILTPGQPEGLAQATLLVRRRNPTVLVLPTGQVFIGGGIGADGQPVTTLEWLSLPDLASLGTAELCSAGTEQGFALTEEGAVLAVMGPESGTAGCSNVHLVRPPSATTAAVVDEAPILDPPPAHIRIFQGPSASPVLVTDAAALRWNPWTGTFTSLGTNTGGVSPESAGSVSASPGLGLWLGQDSLLWALRFDTRGQYATDFAHASYLDTDDLYTAPDRLESPDAGFTVPHGAPLSNGESIFLTDATYQALTASVTLITGGTLSFVLRDPTGLEILCSATNVPDAATVMVTRSGSSVTIGVGSGPSTPCVGASALDPNARVAVGLRAPPSGTSRVRSLTVTR
jgi:hypothetical protein